MIAESTITIRAPIDRVFWFLDDPNAMCRWQPARVEPVGVVAAQRGPGDRFVLRTYWAGGVMDSTTEIVARQAPTLLVHRSSSTVATVTSEWYLEPAGAGTIVRARCLSGQQPEPGLAGLFVKMFQAKGNAMAASGLRSSLDTLRQCAERG